MAMLLLRAIPLLMFKFGAGDRAALLMMVLPTLFSAFWIILGSVTEVLLLFITEDVAPVGGGKLCKVCCAIVLAVEGGTDNIRTVTSGGRACAGWLGGVGAVVFCMAGSEDCGAVRGACVF